MEGSVKLVALITMTVVTVCILVWRVVVTISVSVWWGSVGMVLLMINNWISKGSILCSLCHILCQNAISQSGIIVTYHCVWYCEFLSLSVKIWRISPSIILAIFNWVSFPVFTSLEVMYYGLIANFAFALILIYLTITVVLNNVVLAVVIILYVASLILSSGYW